MTAVQFGHPQEIGVPLDFICQGAGGLQGNFLPVSAVLQTVEQPVLEGAVFLFLPGLSIPAALVLGAFDELDVGVVLDQRDATFNQPCVILRPVLGKLDDGL
jgi:hypothetical protein